MVISICASRVLNVIDSVLITAISVKYEELPGVTYFIQTSEYHVIFVQAKNYILESKPCVNI